jgi:hypothetical protein
MYFTYPLSDKKHIPVHAGFQREFSPEANFAAVKVNPLNQSDHIFSCPKNGQ